jgi:hypothetical protein
MTTEAEEKIRPWPTVKRRLGIYLLQLSSVLSLVSFVLLYLLNCTLPPTI